MQSVNTTASAMLAEKQQSSRSNYSLGVAPDAIGVPSSWLLFWLFNNQLGVSLESVRELANDPEAVREALESTGEFPTSPEIMRQLAERFPDEYRPYVESKLLPKQASTDPVCGEEQESEALAQTTN